MMINVKDIKKIIYKILILVLTIALICLGFKLAIFYMPFLIAFEKSSLVMFSLLVM